MSGVGPLVFTVLVAAGQGDSPESRALLQALVEALGAEVRAVLREQETIDDEAMLALEQSTASDVAAAVSWSPDRLLARVRLHVRASDRFIERSLGFAASDEPRERGRTLGFTMASMLPGRSPPAAAARPPPPIVVIQPAAAPPSRLALDLMVMGSLGVGGNADALGGAFAFRRALSPRLAVRAELLGRTGVVQAAQATSLSLHLTVGLTANLLGDPAARGVHLALRGDAGAFYESLGHLSEDDVDRVRQARVLPGGDLVLEASLPVLGSAAVVLGFGTEVALGRTDVFVHDRQVAVVPALRLVTSLGLRHHF